MLKTLFYAIIITLTTISISFAGSTPNMEEGEWEITTKMEMPGMPMAMPPTVHTQCITKDDLVPQSNSQPGQECKISQMDSTGDTVSWTVICKDQSGEMKGTGKITYKGTSFKGSVKMTMSQSDMEMTSHISGRRIGECK